ncbi:MAG: hypothetical protein SPK00_01275 [Corynebacterium glucuronolyticum]|nr:hypothetical protein [Corynebacterium glucuronolyticum]MDD7586725.1 hypothetical protein [Mycobacteriaceae bacterium]MDY5833374.1 hypothetical protein [Corynebacterium glucuronolyticum]
MGIATTDTFLALSVGSFPMAFIAGTRLLDTFDSFTDGLVSSVGVAGVLIAMIIGLPLFFEVGPLWSCS